MGCLFFCLSPILSLDYNGQRSRCSLVVWWIVRLLQYSTSSQMKFTDSNTLIIWLNFHFFLSVLILSLHSYDCDVFGCVALSTMPIGVRSIGMNNWKWWKCKISHLWQSQIPTIELQLFDDIFSLHFFFSSIRD